MPFSLWTPLYRWTAIPRQLHNTMAVLNSTGTSGYEKKSMGTIKISEHYEVDMNTLVLNYMLAYTYRLIHTHTHLISLSSLYFLFSPSLLSKTVIIECVYCLSIFFMHLSKSLCMFTTSKGKISK